MQDCSNSSALAVELLQFCTKPSICLWKSSREANRSVPLNRLVYEVLMSGTAALAASLHLAAHISMARPTCRDLHIAQLPVGGGVGVHTLTNEAWHTWPQWTLRLPSLSNKTFYHQISRSLEASRYVFGVIVSFWHFTGVFTTMLPRNLSNFRAIW